MKKFFLLAFAALSMSVMAQHVTPVSIKVTDVKLDSLRAKYMSEPIMYRAALNTLLADLNKDGDALKAAKAELKVEKAHAGEIDKTLKQASKLAASLKKLYTKEENELRTMQKAVEKQQKTLNKQKELNQETRDSYLRILERQQKELGYSLREVAERQRAVAELETTIQNKQTNRQTYVQETQQKTVELSTIELQIKERIALVKAELKSANAMQ